MKNSHPIFFSFDLKHFLTSLLQVMYFLFSLRQVLSYSGDYFHESFLDAGKYVSLLEVKEAVLTVFSCNFVLQLHFLGSVLSFYFPYDFCLYRKIDPLISYFIRFLPLIVALFVVPITYQLRYEDSIRIKKLHVFKQYINTPTGICYFSFFSRQLNTSLH